MSNRELPYWLLSAAILLAALYSTNAKAETAVLLGGWSDHVISDEDYNESHEATLIEYDNYMAGRFTNSHDRNTWAAGYGWAKRWGHWRGSVHVGGLWGYRGCYRDDADRATLCPMVYPALTYTEYQVRPQVGVLGEAVVFIVRARL